MLRLEDLSIHRGTLCVADKLCAEFQRGKVYAILGPNGAGKSSLLSTLFAELSFKGKISFKDEILSFSNHFAWKKKIAYMPQDSNVDASLSALEVVLLGLLDSLGMVLSDEQIKKALEVMDSLGILHLADKDILNLSGGQRQMVMFASVLIKSPEILLLDEPVSALDMHHQCVLLESVRKSTYEKGLLTIMILHDLSLAAQFADEILILHDAKIRAKGEAKEVLKRDIIEPIYRVRADIFKDDDGKPIVLAKAAI
ncbi:ABC transporter ATP-binding protein [Campylobacter sp. MIT 19-121]|uniref:ABC transporter ATP-binding protein n=1 Tax=Campylobacter sp. MIT 19-121 TaxID=2703906 RepID=UPI001389A12D|nr:ABC transporter ATP-binding protein [Campylobacter sp. MIT 19-121]NDJ26585.1 ABC transporter ATP-binding protein [Campylobacter sp. MIT 19-121]